MVALDLLGRRWTLRILWELRDGPVGFRDLQARCDGMSSSVLRTRLVELVDYGLIEQEETYALTKQGRALGAALDPLSTWANGWRSGRP